MLEKIRSPKDLKELNDGQLNQLTAEIREKIIATVSENGGHLASNLGAVELTLALHRAMDCPRDQILFDVGHQCYTHKLITGRADRFDTLRKTDGLCGFPRTQESEYDCWNTGHASNSISVALGMARARDLKGSGDRIAVVIGDGALTGGMAYEGLNDAGGCKTQLLVILNDNGMSISGNVGAINNYLTHMRLSKGWQNLKKGVTSVLSHIPLCGSKLQHGFGRVKDRIRNVFVHDKLFTALGWHYFGPVDGNDIKDLEKTIRRSLELKEPVLIHVYTKKGSGFTPAQDHPSRFHGTPPFSVENGAPFEVGDRDFGRAACDVLCEEAKVDDKITVVTAAMTLGTGMKPFSKQFPKRIFDVGIAQEHAVTMAAGLAYGGLKPFAAIYDSFLQRGYDQLLEDLCLQKAKVCLLCDRAGIGSSDGASHHGVFGTSYLLTAPGLTVLQPMNREELKQMLRLQLKKPGLRAIRYAKQEQESLQHIETHFTEGKWQVIRQGGDAALISCGNLLAECLKVADALNKEEINLRVVNASSITPMDTALLKSLNIPYFVAQEGILNGGLGSHIATGAIKEGYRQPEAIFALQDAFIPHGSHSQLLKQAGLDAGTLQTKILNHLRKQSSQGR